MPKVEMDGVGFKGIEVKLSGSSNKTTICLTELGVTSLTSVDGDFTITDIVELCENIAVELETQATVPEGSRIGGIVTISGNKNCSVP